ncbi:MAG: thioredoxin domain-containing protein [Candidatus Aenigmarchaeota archaeon]|nr:thioredoxin domain-containing protein [Candidatus Aenigmarchaeota archaeon]
MKGVLVFTILVISLFSVSAFALSPIPLQVSTSLDKSSLGVGEKLIVSSKVSYDGTMLTNATVSMWVEQAGSKVAILSPAVSGGVYTAGYVPDKAGSFKVNVNATYGEFYATSSTDFSVQSVQTTVTTSTTIPPKAISDTVKNLNTRYFPADYFEPRITITDENGKVVTDASVAGSISQNGVNIQTLYFFYSNLCDCYKSSAYLKESMIGGYSLDFTATKSGYPSLKKSYPFTIDKPTLLVTVKSEKETYYGEENAVFYITATDKSGTSVDASFSGELRDEKGFLINQVYPFRDGNQYKYSYYIGRDQVGKTLTLKITGTWKEQKTDSSVSIAIQKRTLSVDVSLSSENLKAGDYLRGKIKVTDQFGTAVKDAFVDANLFDPQGKSISYFTSSFKDGVYELDQRRVEDWFSSGTYILKIKIDKTGDTSFIEKKITIQKDKLGLIIEFDKPNYRPGDRVFVKFLVTSPTGEVLSDAFVSGELFPLTTETRKLPEFPPQPQVCRNYINPQGPIFYKGQFIQKYYVGETFLNDFCPEGKYALRIKVERQGYEPITEEREIEVTLTNMLMETGTKVTAEVDARVDMYAELKDERGNFIKDAQIFGYIHPEAGGGCIKNFDMFWDFKTNRFSSNQYLNRYECPEGNYIVEINAKHRNFRPVNTTQVILVKYNKNFEYRDIRPIAIPVPIGPNGPPPEQCQVVSCGPNCFEKFCGPPACTKTQDVACVSNCKSLNIEQVGIQTVQTCLQQCEKEQCNYPQSSSQDDIRQKLDQIQKDVRDTKQQVNVVEGLLRSIIDFINSLFGTKTAEIRPITTLPPSTFIQTPTTPIVTSVPQVPLTKPLLIDTSNAPLKGGSKAKVSLIIFSDFQDPFYGRFIRTTLPDIEKEYVSTGRVNIYFKHFPLSFHPDAQKASEAAACAQDQGKFWEYHDSLINNQAALDSDSLKKYALSLGLDSVKFDSCLDSRLKFSVVNKDMQEAEKIGVSGSPTFFTKNKMLVGAQPYPDFKALLDSELSIA